MYVIMKEKTEGGEKKMKKEKIAKQTLEEAKAILEEIRHEWLYRTEDGSPVVGTMVNRAISRIENAIKILE